MIDYEKLQDVHIKDLIGEEKFKYYCIHVATKKRCYSVKEFCEILDNNTYISCIGNIKMIENVIIPYLIETGALVPSMQDPINYACINTPHVYHRVRWYHNPNSNTYTSVIHPDKDRNLLTIQRIKDIFFDENGNFQLPEHQNNSAYTKETIFKLYNYMIKCYDCPTEDIEIARRYLSNNNLLPDEDLPSY